MQPLCVHPSSGALKFLYTKDYGYFSCEVYCVCFSGVLRLARATRADQRFASDHQATAVFEMPIYEYHCESCGHSLEALQKISDSPLVNCPACSAASLQKLVSAASFRLKGGGWYETDFKTGEKRKLADSGGEPASSGSEQPQSGKKTPDTKGDKCAQKSKPSEGNSSGSAKSTATTSMS